MRMTQLTRKSVQNALLKRPPNSEPMCHSSVTTGPLFHVHKNPCLGVHPVSPPPSLRLPPSCYVLAPPPSAAPGLQPLLIFEAAAQDQCSLSASQCLEAHTPSSTSKVTRTELVRITLLLLQRSTNTLVTTTPPNPLLFFLRPETL